jgi:alkylation response protein AidB-like acyl-CoA dehydrogenase
MSAKFHPVFVVEVVTRGNTILGNMNHLLPGDEDERRTALRRWLADNPRPSGRQLAEAGYVAPHLPVPWGLGADPIHQLIIDDELKRAGVSRPSNAIGIGWAGPTIVHAGSEEQKRRYVPKILSGEEIWCQLFSEPEAGSDLASLRTRAVLDGDEWVVNGQKIWTSGAQHSQFGILLARTDPDAPKHRGITYFICPMDAPGIEVRPIREMTGGETFNEVFLTDVRLSRDAVVGEVNDGWRLAKVTLGNERVSLSTGGILWGHGPTAMNLIDQIRTKGGVTDPVMRRRVVDVWIEHQMLELIRMRTLVARLRGEQPGPEASIRKILADEHGQHVAALAVDMMGADGVLGANVDIDHAVWTGAFLFSQALTVGGGTGNVQRNIVAERVLQLPHEPGIV